MYIGHLVATDDANNDANGNAQTANVYGAEGLDTSDLSSFTAFASVDAAAVQGWVEASLNATDSDTVANMKAGLRCTDSCKNNTYISTKNN